MTQAMATTTLLKKYSPKFCRDSRSVKLPRVGFLGSHGVGVGEDLAGRLDRPEQHPGEGRQCDDEPEGRQVCRSGCAALKAAYGRNAREAVMVISTPAIGTSGTGGS